MEKRKWSKEEVIRHYDRYGRWIYCNREDANFFVRKRYGIGWTINMAHPASWIFLAVCAAAVVISLIWEKFGR